MKTIKKILSGILTASLLSTTLVFPTFANNDISVVLNGNSIDFDVPPQIINERTMVPLRAIFEALGASVEWNGDAPQYVSQCMNYYGALLSGIPHLPKTKIEAELAGFEQMDNDSKKAIMPKKRLIYASRVGKPSWAEQYRSILRAKGIL